MPTFLGAHAIPENFQSRQINTSAWSFNEMLPRVAEERLAEFCDVFCERGYFDIEIRAKILSAAKEHGLGLRMHVDQLTNSAAARNWRRELGAATADHLEQTERRRDRRDEAQAGVQPVLLPGSVYALGKTRYPRAREMIEAGLGRRACDRFQSRFFADAVDADGACRSRRRR